MLNCENKICILSIISTLKDTSVGIWNRERLQTVLYKAVKHEDVEIAAKCLKLGVVDVNTRYEPVSKTFHLQLEYLGWFNSIHKSSKIILKTCVVYVKYYLTHCLSTRLRHERFCAKLTVISCFVSLLLC